MLKKEMRLLGPISNNAKKISTPEFNIKYVENELDRSRFAFIVSKKVDRRAVVRNRAKRILRNCIEENLTRIKKSYDFIFILKKNIIDKERDEVQKILINLLKEQNLYD